MIVAGRVSQKMAPVLRQVYDQMMEPKWVISMGVCASTGGMFNNYAIVQGVDEIVPVDVYAPGCPPSPQTLIHAILTLHEKVRTGEITRRRHDGKGAGIDLAAEPVPGVGSQPLARRSTSGRRADGGGDRSRRARHGAAEPGRRRARVGRGARRPRRALDERRAARRSCSVARSGYLDAVARAAAPPGSTCAATCARSTTCGTSTATLPDGVDARALRGRRRAALALERAATGAAARPGAGGRPDAPDAVRVYPGTENMEREVFDLFGIVFERSPRPDQDPHAGGLGGPSAAQGLLGRARPGAVQRSSGSAMSEERGLKDLAADGEVDPFGEIEDELIAETDEGPQGMLDRDETSRRELAHRAGRRAAAARRPRPRSRRRRHRASATARR